MTTKELIKHLISNHDDLVDELVKEILQKHLDSAGEDLAIIRNGGRPNVFSMDPFEDYIYLLDRHDALKKTLEYFS